MNTVIRVNTRERTTTSQAITAEEARWGGRSFIAHLLLREVPPTCEPTGRRNKLVFASGLLADTGRDGPPRPGQLGHPSGSV